MLIKFVGIYITCIIFQHVRGAEEKIETSCNINLKKSIQCVSDKFLSISIDPAVLLAGVNLSETSLHLAQHLSPAYIRIAGPSTSFVNYVDKDDRFANYLSEDGNSVIVTPSMWFGINEWFKLANLMPVYGINDIDTEAGNWNPKSVLPLLEISDKLNVSCYWQLGFDSANKTEMTYEQDLNILHDVLEGFTERNDTWKTVGSDISPFSADRVEKMMVELKDVVNAVMWEPPHITEVTFPEKDMSYKILQKNSKPNVKIWTTAPKSSETVVFSSVLLWAKQIGNAAKTGYDVVFRQPRMHELFSDTPVYWFSILHKMLMGSNVLEVRTTSNRAETNIFAHCTRKQNSFVRRGALTVMIVNDNSETYMVKVKLGTTPPEKSMEVQSYILTAPELNSTQVFLNGKPLTSEMLKEKKLFEPKVRRAKTPSHLYLSLPALSVGFFVLPGARVPVCIDQEIETKLLLEEMEENQNIPLSEEVALKFDTRGSFVKNHVLDEMTKKMKQEMMFDERYYSHPSLKSRLENSKEEEIPKRKNIDERGRKFFIDRVKLAEKHKKNRGFERKRDELRKFLSEKSKTNEAEPKMESKVKELHLTSVEVEKILKDRARARAARRNIVFTDEELRALVHKASKKFYKARIKRSIPLHNRDTRDINVRMLERTVQLNPSCEKLTGGQEYENKEISRNFFVRKPRDVNAKLVELKAKLAESKSKWEDKKDEFLGNRQIARNAIKDRIRKLKDKKRFKRDINMELLDVELKPTKKMDMQKKRQKKKKTEMEATMREPGQSSAELLEQLEFEKGQVENHRKEPKNEVYAELADSEDLEAEEFFKPTQKPKRLKLFDKKSKLDPFGIPNPSIDIVEPPFRKSKKGKKKSKSKSDNLHFLTSSEEFTDIEDDLPCIHEYFGPETKSERKKQHGNVITELGEFSSAEKLKRKKNKKSKNFSEGTSSEEDSRRRKRSVYLEPYNPNESSEPNSRLEYLESLLEKMDLKCSECGNQRDGSSEKEYDDRIERLKRGVYLRKGLQNSAEIIRDLNENSSDEGGSAEVERQKRNSYLTERFSDYPELIERVNEYSKGDIKFNGESERFKRGMFLGKGSKESTKLIERVNELETLLEDLEKKYMECLSKRIDQFGMNASHSSIKEFSNDMTPPQEDPKNLQTIARQKRGEIPPVESDLPTIENDFKDYKNNLKKHLEDLKQLLEEDKLKFEEKKRKNKLKLLQLKKKQELELAKEAMEVVSRIHKNETETGSELLEHLRKIQEDLRHKKEKLDKLLTKDMKTQGRKEKNEITQRSEIIAEKQNVLNKAGKNKENSNTLQSTAQEKYRNNHDKIPVEVKMVKRSIFDGNDIFGTYQPLTPQLRIWKPADILSLKKDFNPFNANKIIPPNDLHLFKNIFDQNNLLTLRKRRSIDSSMDNLENEIGTDFNEIKKESRNFWPEKYSENEELKFVLPNQDEFEIQENDGVTEIKFLHHNDNKKVKFDTDNSFKLLEDETSEDIEPPDYKKSISSGNKDDFVEFLKKKEQKGSGVTEAAMFSYLFTNNPLESSINSMKGMMAHRKNGDKVDHFSVSEKKGDSTVTEDSLYPNLFEFNPLEVLSRNDEKEADIETVQNHHTSHNVEQFDALIPHELRHGFLKNSMKEMTEDKIIHNEYVTDKPKIEHVTENTPSSFIFGKNTSDEEKSTDTLEGIKHNIANSNQNIVNNIQKIPLPQEQKMFGDLISNLTGFFSKINKQIQNYVKQIIN